MFKTFKSLKFYSLEFICFLELDICYLKISIAPFRSENLKI